ncbi:MAG: J domain-containing protein [Actinobacteria bacterium]|nr:J domain-containing protein [Actinomycetota bacterium]
MQNRDYYVVLGVPEHATPGEIRRAYHARVRHAHPDVNTQGHRETVLLNSAYETLSNPHKRAAYDRWLSTSLPPEVHVHRVVRRRPAWHRILLGLAVVVVIYPLAITAWPGADAEAQDAKARSLVRTAVLDLEAATRWEPRQTFDTDTLPALLRGIALSITFVPSSVPGGGWAQAAKNEVAVGGESSSYWAASVSETGSRFVIIVNRPASGGSYFVYLVEKDGETFRGW